MLGYFKAVLMFSLNTHTHTHTHAYPCMTHTHTHTHAHAGTHTYIAHTNTLHFPSVWPHNQIIKEATTNCFYCIEQLSLSLSVIILVQDIFIYIFNTAILHISQQRSICFNCFQRSCYALSSSLM